MALDPLDIYSNIESSLEFEDEIQSLYNQYLTYIKQYKCNSLLDVGCGQGNLLRQINTSNPSITTLGIDLSPSQISICKAKNLNAMCIPLEELENTKFDMIIAVFDVLNYIPPKELKSFFHHIKQRLNKNGKFIFDINSKFGFEEVAQGCIIVEDSDDKFSSIDAIFENDILYTTINSFERKSENYKREVGTIKQYYHDEKTIKKYSNMQLQKINFHLHTDSNEPCDKYIYICSL